MARIYRCWKWNAHDEVRRVACGRESSGPGAGPVDCTLETLWLSRQIGVLPVDCLPLYVCLLSRMASSENRGDEEQGQLLLGYAVWRFGEELLFFRPASRLQVHTCHGNLMCTSLRSRWLRVKFTWAHLRKKVNLVNWIPKLSRVVLLCCCEERLWEEQSRNPY